MTNVPCHPERSEGSHEILRLSLRMTSALFCLVYLVMAAPVFSATEDLRQSIESKAQELLKINQQIQEIQGKIGATQTQQRSLKNELKKIDYSINQLNLGIRSSQINLEKLGLELEALELNINEINASIGNRRLAITKLLRTLYENDRQGFLPVLLNNTSLADALLETESIASLNTGLAVELNNLKVLGVELDKKFDLTSEKKHRVGVENKNLLNRRGIVQDQKSERENILTVTKNREKSFASLLSILAEKQKAISAEIEAIEKELRATIDPSLLPIPRPGVLGLPVVGVLTQNYGHTEFSYNYKGSHHNGVDFGAPPGAEVMSAESGRVVAVGDQDAYSACRGGAYGKFVVVEHDNNLVTLYAHLSRYAAQKGDTVTRGQLIGYVGRTGYATGPHLHFTVYAGPTFYMGASRVCGPMPLGGDLNPLDYLDN